MPKGSIRFVAAAAGVAVLMLSSATVFGATRPNHQLGKNHSQGIPGEIANLEAAWNTLSATVGSLSNQVTQLLATVTAQGAAITGLGQSVTAQVYNVNSLTETVASQAAEIQQLQSENVNQAIALNNLNSTVSSQQSTINSLTQEVNTLAPLVPGSVNWLFGPDLVLGSGSYFDATYTMQYQNALGTPEPVSLNQLQGLTVASVVGSTRTVFTNDIGAALTENGFTAATDATDPSEFTVTVEELLPENPVSSDVLVFAGLPDGASPFTVPIEEGKASS